MATTRKTSDETSAPKEGAAKLIRTNFRQDQFDLGGGTVLTGELQEFPAKRAAEVVALARRAGVDIVVTDKEN